MRYEGEGGGRMNEGEGEWRRHKGEGGERRNEGEGEWRRHEGEGGWRKVKLFSSLPPLRLPILKTITCLTFLETRF